MVDFEAALRGGISLSYPDSNIRGCKFHFVSAIKRWCRNHGLSEIWKTEILEMVTQFAECDVDPIERIQGLIIKF